MESNFLNIFVLSLLSLFFFLINTIFREKISSFLGIIDSPSKEKIHKNPTPLNGSFHVFFIYISAMIFIMLILKEKIDFDFIIIFFVSSISFIIGLFDDKFKIKYLNKFILFISLYIASCFFSENLILDKFYFETFEKVFYLEKLNSTFITILCLLLLVNSINLSDGINGLSCGISIIFIFYVSFFLNDSFNFVTYLILFGLFLSLIPIYKNYYFLGNSGTHFLGTFIGLITIKFYNLNLPVLKTPVEEIFILLMLPGFDMLRLFIFRAIKSSNPFLSDLEHLHHYLIKKFKLFKSLIIYFSSMLIPIILYKFSVFEPIIIILMFVVYYISLIKILK